MKDKKKQKDGVPRIVLIEQVKRQEIIIKASEDLKRTINDGVKRGFVLGREEILRVEEKEPLDPDLVEEKEYTDNLEYSCLYR